MRTPASAPRPTPTMIDMGVARPSAQGQAMMSTDTAATRPKVRRGSGPNMAQAAKARMATARTSGTNQAATRSVRRWIGARLRCACATICTICASMVSAPILSARMMSAPLPLMAPPINLSPVSLVTGMLSPVTKDSSTALRPDSTTPSTGILSPGRTRNSSPTCTRSRPMTSSPPSACSRRAVVGVRSSKARIAPPVCSRARNSSTCPTMTRTMITVAASK